MERAGLRRTIAWFAAVAAIGALSILSSPISATEHTTTSLLPEILVIESIPGDLGAARFGHKLHSEKAKGCADCHHHSSAEETRKCAQCHDLKKMALKEALVESFLPCKSCHRKQNVDDPSMPGLLTAFHRQCFTCHKVEGPKACEMGCHEKSGNRK